MLASPKLLPGNTLSKVRSSVGMLFQEPSIKRGYNLDLWSVRS